jgi:uncharacterized membrane protein YbhN (UPF0104 family)
MPFGGAAGVAVGLAMTRSWGFRTSSYALSTLLTNLVNLLAKLVLPLLALAALGLSHHFISRELTIAAWTATVCLFVVIVLICAALAYEPVADRAGRILQAIAVGGARVCRIRRPITIHASLLEQRTHCRSLLVRRWPVMSAAIFGYVALQGLLLWMILRMLHAGLGPAEVFAGFALERFLSLALVTPAGVGIAQTGAAALLVALGGHQVETAAGVLLFSVFTFLIEIPIGSAAGLWWWSRQRRKIPPAGAQA